MLFTVARTQSLGLDWFYAFPRVFDAMPSAGMMTRKLSETGLSAAAEEPAAALQPASVAAAA